MAKFYGWTVPDILSLPINAFNAMIEESNKIIEQSSGEEVYSGEEAAKRLRSFCK